VQRKIPSGGIFRKAYTDRHGKRCHARYWYVKFYIRGKPTVLSTETEDYDEAVAFLRKKLAQSSQQAEYTSHPERVRMTQLFDLLLEFYRNHEKRSTYDVERKIESRLRPYFGKMKADAVTSTAISRYVSSRRAEKPKPANASINRELAYVRRALKLGAMQEPPLVVRVPHFEMLPEDNAREGTLSHDKYRLLRDALPRHARVAFVLAYHTGARKGELRQIRRDRIDFKTSRIELPSRTTKNKKPRFLPIYGDMESEIQLAIAEGSKDCPFLIQREGRPVHDWEKAWASACSVAGVPSALFHDLRRTALTNMIEAGLSEKEAMEISGHKTRAVFDRYHIVSDRRLKEMAKKLDAHLKVKAAATGAEPEDDELDPAGGCSHFLQREAAVPCCLRKTQGYPLGRCPRVVQDDGARRPEKPSSNSAKPFILDLAE
jgi:integrase